MATLVIDNGPTAPDALATRTGGVPLAPPGTPWPVCATCGGPMQFLAQVLLNGIDNDTGSSTTPAADADRGILALFACQNDPGMCEDWNPASGGNRALLLPTVDLQPLPLHEGTDQAVLVLGAVRAVATEQDDDPDYNEAREAWAARTGHPDSSVLGQLGGTPAWIQGDETPACPRCARPMALAVQLEEGPDHSTAMNFGGGGCAYAFTYEPCTQALLLWQC